MTADDLRALSAAATPGPWDVVYRLCPEDGEICMWLRNHADALADLIDAAHLVLPDFDGGVAYKLGTDNLRGLGNALLALEADA